MIWHLGGSGGSYIQKIAEARIHAAEVAVCRNII